MPKSLGGILNNLCVRSKALLCSAIAPRFPTSTLSRRRGTTVSPILFTKSMAATVVGRSKIIMLSTRVVLGRTLVKRRVLFYIFLVRHPDWSTEAYQLKSQQEAALGISARLI